MRWWTGCRLLRCVVEERKVGGSRYHLFRRRKIACIAEVQAGAGEGLIDEVGARAELVGIDVLVHLIEADPEIEGELVGELPLVLQVNSHQPAELRRAVDHTEGRINWRAGHGIDGQQCIPGGDLAVLSAHDKSGTQRVRWIETEGGVGLHAVVEAAAKDIGGNPVEDEIADEIRLEMHRAVAGEVGDLQIGIGELLLQGDDVVEVPLELALIEIGGIEVANAKGSELWWLPRSIGDLVVLDRNPTDRGETRGGSEQRRGVAEGTALLGLIVDRIDGGRGIFKAQISEEGAASEEIFRLPAGPAVLDAGRQCRAVATIDTDRAARVLGAAA